MLLLKSTLVKKAPGIYEVDVAARPPGKTYGVYMAVDPDNQPKELIDGLLALNFKNTHHSPYVHKDKGKVMDLHFQKAGTDIFEGWKDAERTENLAAIASLFAAAGIAVTPRVMTFAEANA